MAAVHCTDADNSVPLTLKSPGTLPASFSCLQLQDHKPAPISPHPGPTGVDDKCPAPLPFSWDS